MPDATPRTDADGGVGSSLVHRVLTVPTRYYDVGFTLVLLAFVCLLLVVNFQYRGRTQWAPFLIGVPTAVMLAILLVIQTSRRARRVTRRLVDTDVMGMQRSRRAADSAEGSAGRTLPEVRVVIAAACLWVAALYVVILLVGFLAGLLVFLPAVYRVQAGQSWPRTIAYSAAVWLFVVLVFAVTLHAPLYTGLFGVEIPLPT